MRMDPGMRKAQTQERDELRDERIRDKRESLG